MSFKPGFRSATLIAIVCFGAISQVVLAGPAGAVTADKAQLANGELRLEGQSTPGVFVIAESTSSIAGVRANPTGSYKLRATDFTAPDCRVTIRDGGRTPTVTVTLDGCTPSVTPVPPTPAPPTGSCVIIPPASVTVPAGTPIAINFDTTGCNTTFESGATPTPVQWTIVAGSIPTGMTGPFSQGTTAGHIVGTPSIPGTYDFTLQVTDQIGSTDQQNLSVSVS